MDRGKFVVDTYFQRNEDEWSEINYRGDDPRIALEVWAEREPYERTCVSINVRTRDDAYELIKYAYDNLNWLLLLCEERGVSYRKEFLTEAISKAYQNKCKDFNEYSDGYGEYYRDQVHPFCLG